MGAGVLTGGAAGDAAAAPLTLGGVALDAVAAAVGTPAYVYALPVVRARYEALAVALADALPDVPHRVHYSMKANGNRAVLRTLRDLGSGVDIVSGGELAMARAAGFTGADVVFSGVGKRDEELDAAVVAGVQCVNVESVGELRRLDAVAGARRLVAPVALRVNPEVTVDTPHAYIATGEKGHKFGIPYDEVPAAAALAASLDHVRLVGLAMHIGSQVTSWAPFADAADRLVALLARLRAEGHDAIRSLDVGGGLGVTYVDEPPADLGAFAAGLARTVRGRDVSIVLEPGRYLVGEAGVLLTRVVDRKRSGGTEYAIVDAGMTDLVRPALYQAVHRITPVSGASRTTHPIDVVGPVCESGDFLGLGVPLPDVAVGELLAVHTAGAYGAVMSSTYNGRPRPAEVVVDDGRFAVAAERETPADLMRRERDTLDWRST